MLKTRLAFTWTQPLNVNMPGKTSTLLSRSRFFLTVLRFSSFFSFDLKKMAILKIEVIQLQNKCRIQFFESFGKNGFLQLCAENLYFSIFEHFKIFFAKKAFLRGKTCLCLSTWDDFFKNDSKKSIFESVSMIPKF